MSAVTSADIELERGGGGAVVWFNRPGRLNAFRDATFARLHRVFDEIDADPTIDFAILTGRGRAFCAGEDLDEMDGTATSGFSLRGARTSLMRLQDLTRRIAARTKPVAAAINGPAVGLGAELPLACDFRVATPEAYFFFSEARRGMLETNGCFHLLPRIIGAGRAAEWLLTARKVGSAEAAAAGLVTAVVPGPDLLDTAIGLIRDTEGGRSS
jgi:2-(1,2-epoxy-1,2-dihydrophenyl)acetyl-CoA isomerase